MHYFYNELYLLALSHDEVVHGKKTIIDKLWGTYEEKCAQLRTLYSVSYTHLLVMSRSSNQNAFALSLIISISDV